MLSKKGLIGTVIGAVVLGTRVGREQVGKLVAMVSARLGGGGGSDPFAVAPSAGDIDVASETSAASLPPEERLALAEQLPPTPGTVALAVGAPNAPDLDVIAGDHDGAHRPER